MGKLRLSGIRSVVVRDAEGNCGKILYRQPTADEWVQFQGDLAECISSDIRSLAPEKEKEGASAALSTKRSVAALLYSYGSKLVTGGEDFEFDEKIDSHDAVKVLCNTFPSLIAEIGKSVFMDGGGYKLDLGKSDKPLAPSTKGVSAPSSK